ncbi:MAG: hypothetical protein WC728_07780 [Elusimicrobiota bacterium]
MAAASLLISFILASNGFFLVRTNPFLLIQMGLSAVAAAAVAALAGALLWPVASLRHRGGRTPEEGEHPWTVHAGIVTGVCAGLWALIPLLSRSEGFANQLPPTLVLAGYGFSLRRWAKSRQYVPLFSATALLTLAAIADCLLVLRSSESGAALLAGDRLSRQLNTVPLAAALTWAGWRVAWACERSPAAGEGLP